MFEGTEREVVIQESVMTCLGVDRVLKYAYELAAKWPKEHLTQATKSNGISITMPFWDGRVEAMAKNYPDIRTDTFHIDILPAHFVLHPDWFDVVVASNLFGDILSSPSGNINPERKFPSLFEPVYGSAPDIAGKSIANPIGQIWSGALMLEFSGYQDAHDAILAAVRKVLAAGPANAPLTRDMGGTGNTADLGFAIESIL